MTNIVASDDMQPPGLRAHDLRADAAQIHVAKKQRDEAERQREDDDRPQCAIA